MDSLRDLALVFNFSTVRVCFVFVDGTRLFYLPTHHHHHPFLLPLPHTSPRMGVDVVREDRLKMQGANPRQRQTIERYIALLSLPVDAAIHLDRIMHIRILFAERFSDGCVPRMRVD